MVFSSADSLDHEENGSAECGRGMINEFVRRARDTQAFLRMAAIELRRIAERSPDIASELYHISRQLEADADELAAKTSE